jgi:co-chaperonin GroES (HSP10)
MSKKFPEFTPMNGRVMLFPPKVFDKTRGGIMLTDKQKTDAMLAVDNVWQVAAIDPTSGLAIKQGDYVFIDVQSTGDILETELEGTKVYIVAAYAIIAKASDLMAESMAATDAIGVGIGEVAKA